MPQTTRQERRKKVSALRGLALGIGFLTATAPGASRSSIGLLVPDLLGSAQQPLPPGVLHVQDIAADPRGYQGSILESV